ncbi:uncharacterized protein HGUI_02424 [Hanseniaspora guilliermondii]|uniref:BHLH domain-containing protein n=1 Tax=Hanseniaspora guilliermondii TaxID=56406 RepID=A0A1L0B1C3_9ASCO|nr:uncharacterized protein HGUI_02424 [Hanseniaspora guilliermondii]
METPKSEFNFELGTDMELDFDTAYKNFEDNFEDEIEEAVNYNTQQMGLLSGSGLEQNNRMDHTTEVKTPEPRIFNQQGYVGNFQEELKLQGHALTQNTLLLLNAEKTPIKIKDHLASDNQSVISGTFSEIIQKNAAYFQQQIHPSLIIPTQNAKIIPSTRPGTAEYPSLFPVDFNGLSHIKSPTPMSASPSPGACVKSPEPDLIPSPKIKTGIPPTQQRTEDGKEFNLLSVKETSELLNFLTRLENPEPARTPPKKRKLSYDELLKKVDNIEKKLDAHKNKHKLSERKRRAIINDRFNKLITLVKFPRKNDNPKQKRVTKHQQLQYIIEDLEDVTKQNTDIETFLKSHQLLDQFELWKNNIAK